jgi:hypothetical protein
LLIKDRDSAWIEISAPQVRWMMDITIAAIAYFQSGKEEGEEVLRMLLGQYGKEPDAD